MFLKQTLQLKKSPFQQGISLLESVFYIIVVAAIVASITTYFKASSRTQKLADAVSEVTDILQVAAQYWESNQKFDSNFDVTLVIKSGMLPTRYTDLSRRQKIVGNIATPWTESNSSSTITIENQSDKGFDLIFNQIPSYACSPLKQQLLNTGYAVEPDKCDDSSATSTVILHFRIQ